MCLSPGTFAFALLSCGSASPHVNTEHKRNAPRSSAGQKAESAKITKLRRVSDNISLAKKEKSG